MDGNKLDHPTFTWQQGVIKSKLKEFDFENVLGVSPAMDWIVSIYMPFLVVGVWGLNLFALWTLRSRFLRDLVIQPILVTFLHIHNLMTIVGPLYVWSAQSMGLYLYRSQVYPCFLLTWVHNFAMIASAALLVTMVIERSLTVGKPEKIWTEWQKSCNNVTLMVVITSLALGVIGLMCVDINDPSHGNMYPICHPWWDNELSRSHATWNKLLAGMFSITPSIIVTIAATSLLFVENRFNASMRAGIVSLKHYSALLMEIKGTRQIKFVRSMIYLTPLFVFFCSPIGLYIIFSPAMYVSLTFEDMKKGGVHATTSTTPHFNINSTNKTATTTTATTTTTSTTTTTTRHYAPVETTILPGLMDFSYLLVSRCDSETIGWLAYYSFSLTIVPALLLSEVLFRREWKGRMRQVANGMLGRVLARSKWPNVASDSDDPAQGKDMVGPYIANSDEMVESMRGELKTVNDAKLIKVFDARNQERSGRAVGRGSLTKQKENEKTLENQATKPTGQAQETQLLKYPGQDSKVESSVQNVSLGSNAVASKPEVDQSKPGINEIAKVEDGKSNKQVPTASTTSVDPNPGAECKPRVVLHQQERTDTNRDEDYAKSNVEIVGKVLVEAMNSAMAYAGTKEGGGVKKPGISPKKGEQPKEGGGVKKPDVSPRKGEQPRSPFSRPSGAIAKMLKFRSQNTERDKPKSAAPSSKQKVGQGQGPKKQKQAKPSPKKKQGAPKKQEDQTVKTQQEERKSNETLETTSTS